MRNPWLRIPAADYEGHMASPQVAQLSFLAEVFREALAEYDRSAVALLGCATGNGLAHVPTDIACRITAVDFNPEFLEVLRQRYEGVIPGLEIIEADLETCMLENRAYSLIFAGLLLEYVNPQIVFPKIASWLRAGGVLVIVLQLRAEHLADVSDSPYESLKALNSIMRLISPAQLKALAGAAGLVGKEEKTITLRSGKSFYIGTFSK